MNISISIIMSMVMLSAVSFAEAQNKSAPPMPNVKNVPDVPAYLQVEPIIKDSNQSDVKDNKPDVPKYPKYRPNMMVNPCNGDYAPKWCP